MVGPDSMGRRCYLWYMGGVSHDTLCFDIHKLNLVFHASLLFIVYIKASDLASSYRRRFFDFSGHLSVFISLYTSRF